MTTKRRIHKEIQNLKNAVIDLQDTMTDVTKKENGDDNMDKLFKKLEGLEARRVSMLRDSNQSGELPDVYYDTIDSIKEVKKEILEKHPIVVELVKEWIFDAIHEVDMAYGLNHDMINELLELLEEGFEIPKIVHPKPELGTSFEEAGEAFKTVSDTMHKDDEARVLDIMKDLYDNMLQEKKSNLALDGEFPLDYTDAIFDLYDEVDYSNGFTEDVKEEVFGLFDTIIKTQPYTDEILENDELIIFKDLFDLFEDMLVAEEMFENHLTLKTGSYSKYKIAFKLFAMFIKYNDLDLGKIKL